MEIRYLVTFVPNYRIIIDIILKWAEYSSNGYHYVFIMLIRRFIGSSIASNYVTFNIDTINSRLTTISA